MCEREEMANRAHTPHREGFGHDIGEAGVLDSPREAAVCRDEDAQIRPDVESLRIARIHDDDVHGKVGQAPRATSIEIAPGRSTIRTLPPVSYTHLTLPTNREV